MDSGFRSFLFRKEAILAFNLEAFKNNCRYKLELTQKSADFLEKTIQKAPPLSPFFNALNWEIIREKKEISYIKDTLLFLNSQEVNFKQHDS
jgi:hypothetical protein